MSNIIKVVGFDPSLSNWGAAFADLNMDDLTFKVTGLGLVETAPEKDKKLRKVVRKNSEDLERCKLLYEGMIAACDSVVIAFAEVPVGSQSSRAMVSYGACVMALATCPIPLIQVTPNEVKIAGAGHKNATKREMIETVSAAHPGEFWLRQKGRLIDKNEHLADAVATIAAGICTDEFERLVALMHQPLFASLRA